MSFLKWLFEDSKSIPPEEPKTTLQQELKKLQSDAENRTYTEAYESFLSVKQELVTRCIEECKYEASEMRNRHYFSFKASNQRFDFTSDLARELRDTGLKAEKTYPGIILVEW